MIFANHCKNKRCSHQDKMYAMNSEIDVDVPTAAFIKFTNSTLVIRMYKQVSIAMTCNSRKRARSSIAMVSSQQIWRPSTFQEDESWNAAHSPWMMTPIPHNVEASTYNPRSDKGSRGWRDRYTPGKVSLTNYHFKLVISECREYFVRDSSPWKVDMKLEREGRWEWPSR